MAARSAPRGIPITATRSKWPAFSPTCTSRRLEQLHKGEGDLISRIGRGIKAHLEANGVEAEVQGREKHPYSTWRKMAERHVSFEQLSDVMAFRAIVGSVEECYRTLGLIHM